MKRTRSITSQGLATGTYQAASSAASCTYKASRVQRNCILGTDLGGSQDERERAFIPRYDTFQKRKD